MSIDGLNTLNNKHYQRIEELKKELNNKDISLNEYKKKLAALDDSRKQEMQELKKELEESNIKDKNETLKKINDINKLHNEYIEEKRIIGQELNKKRQELSKKKKRIIK